MTHGRDSVLAVPYFNRIRVHPKPTPRTPGTASLPVARQPDTIGSGAQQWGVKTWVEQTATTKKPNL